MQQALLSWLRHFHSRDVAQLSNLPAFIMINISILNNLYINGSAVCQRDLTYQEYKAHSSQDND